MIPKISVKPTPMTLYIAPMTRPFRICWSRITLSLSSQVGFFDPGIVHEVQALPFQDNLPVFKDVSTMSGLERVTDILLHQDDRGPFVVDLHNVAHEALDHQ